MDYLPRNNPHMDIATVIAENLTAWMSTTPALDTFKKLSAKSGVGFGTVQRAKNGDGNITAKSIAAIAEAFGRTPAELMTPPDASETSVTTREIMEPAIAAVEHHARVLVEQSAEVSRRWITLSPARREELLQVLRVETDALLTNAGATTSLARPRRTPSENTGT